jgi:hypothetical protein
MKNMIMIVFLILTLIACKKTTEQPPPAKVRPEGNPIPKCMFVKQGISTMGPRVVSIFFNAVNPEGGSLIENLSVHNLDVWETSQAGQKKKLDWIANVFHLKDKGQLNYASRIVLVLDVSAETDIARIKESANNVVDALSAGQKLSLITFATTVEIIHEFSEDKSSLKSAVDQIVNGGTDSKLYDAVKEGLDSWDDIYSYDKVLQGNLIVVTDSDNSGGRTSLIDLLFIREAGDQPKRIYVYGIGGSVNKEALEELANARHYFLNDINELPGQITQAVQNITDYEAGYYMFDFMSSQTDGVIDVILELIGNQYTGDGSVLEGEFSTRNFFPGAVQPGITINANKTTTAGVTALNLGKIAPRKIVAFNNLGTELSDFVWSTTTDAILKVEEDPKDNRKAIITAVGEVGDVGKLVVDDMANNTTKELNVEIVDAAVGNALFEYFENLPGRGLFLLTTSGKYPDNPDVRTLVTELNITDWSTDPGDDFGCRFRAYLIPPESGLFQFSVTLTDDDQEGELHFSDTPFPDENPQVIAYRTTEGSDVTSEYIMLEEGKIYYLDFIYKEDRQGQTISVRWKRDNDAGDDSVIGTKTVVISGEYMAPFVVDFDMTE